MLQPPQPLYKGAAQKLSRSHNDEEIVEQDFREPHFTPQSKDARPHRPEPQVELKRNLNQEYNNQQQLNPEIINKQPLSKNIATNKQVSDSKRNQIHESNSKKFDTNIHAPPQLQHHNFQYQPQHQQYQQQQKQQSLDKQQLRYQPHLTHQEHDQELQVHPPPPQTQIQNQQREQYPQKLHQQQQYQQNIIRPHNQRVSDQNRVSRLNIDYPQLQHENYLRHEQYHPQPYKYQPLWGNVEKSDRLKDWGEKNEFWKKDAKRRGRMLLPGNDQFLGSNQESSMSQYGSSSSPGLSASKISQSQKSIHSSTVSGPINNKKSHRRDIHQDQIAKPLVNVEHDVNKLDKEDNLNKSFDENDDYQLGINQRQKQFNRMKTTRESTYKQGNYNRDEDLHTHKIKDDVERYEIEQYLNQGQGTFLDDRNQRKHLTPQGKIMRGGQQFATRSHEVGLGAATFDTDHPRHRLDPALERAKDQGNFKFNVCEPEGQMADVENLCCQNCINQKLMYQRRMSQRKPLEEQFQDLNIGHSRDNFSTEMKNTSTFLQWDEERVDKKFEDQKKKQYLRELQEQIASKKQKEKQSEENEKVQDRTELFVENYYHNQYPIYKTEYPLGCLLPCSSCHVVYPVKKLQKFT